MEFKNPSDVQIGGKVSKKKYDAKARRKDILMAAQQALFSGEPGVLESKVSMCSDDAKLIRGMLKERAIRSDVGSGPRNGFHTRLHITEVGMEELQGQKA